MNSHEPLEALSYDIAPTRDSLTIACNYQGHPFYSEDLAICAALHLVFLKITAMQRRISAYGLRRAIHLFFDFTSIYNARNPEELRIQTLTDLTAETYNAFRTYLLKNDEKIVHASTLKGAIKKIAKQSDLIPNLMLPSDGPKNNKVTEPLTDGAYNSLSTALIAHTELMYEKLRFRKVVESATAYDFLEIRDSYSSECNEANFYEWAQYRLDNNLSIKGWHLRLKHSTSPNLKALFSEAKTYDQFKSLFDARPACYHFTAPKDPFAQTLYHWNPDDARALKTLLDNGYPFEIPLNEFATRYAASKLITVSDCDDITQLLLYRFNRFYRTDLVLYPVKRWDDLLAQYFPSMADMACIIMFVMLQSNWNKETVLAVDPENFEHPLTGAMSEAQVIIQSEKNRSQGLNKPYYSPKEMVAVSSKADRYSSYNLIQLASDLSAPLIPYAYDHIPMHHEHLVYNDLFLCMRYYSGWANRCGRHTSATNVKAFMEGIKAFLQTYPVYENGHRLTSPKQITRRLRPTWALFQRKNNGMSLGVLSMQMGHQDTTVTDVHYDSSGAAVQERNQRLRSELEAVMDLLRSRRYEDLIKARCEAPLLLPLKIFHIPGMEKPLWGCSNQRQPTWPGANLEVKPGERCYSIRNCLFCSQINIYEDTLPYLIERRIHVVELIENKLESQTEYSSSFVTEKNIITYILENWGEPEAVKQASRYHRECHRRGQPLLPRDLSLLQLIFEEEDMQ